MSDSPTITPTAALYNKEDLISFLYILIAAAMVGFIYLCVQCCVCVSKSRQYSSSDSSSEQAQPTIEDNKEESSVSYTYTEYEYSSEYY